jgi:hypothetical protein
MEPADAFEGAPLMMRDLRAGAPYVVVAAAAAAVAGGCDGGLTSAEACRRFREREHVAAYIAQNKDVLREVPVYSGAKTRATRTYGFCLAPATSVAGTTLPRAPHRSPGSRSATSRTT